MSVNVPIKSDLDVIFSHPNLMERISGSIELFILLGPAGFSRLAAKLQVSTTIRDQHIVTVVGFFHIFKHV